ncbi:hypothetical protein Golob_020516, partial [Gossypium lobatum]|nr:hypothetical protein [Gossypium lobatum]
WSKYLSFLKSKTFVELTHPKLLTPRTVQTEDSCTVSTSVASLKISRLLSCTDKDLKQYKGHDLPPARYVPSMPPSTRCLVIFFRALACSSPITPWEFKAARDRRFLPLTSKSRTMIKVFLHILSRFTPYESYPLQVRMNFAYFMALHDSYLIGCDNELANIHTRHPDACDKVGGVIVMHIDDLWAFVLLWLLKTEGVRADGAHYATNITGDTY